MWYDMLLICSWLCVWHACSMRTRRPGEVPGPTLCVRHSTFCSDTGQGGPFPISLGSICNSCVIISFELLQDVFHNPRIKQSKIMVSRAILYTNVSFTSFHSQMPRKMKLLRGNLIHFNVQEELWEHNHLQIKYIMSNTTTEETWNLVKEIKSHK